jgi:hypothetical protein
VEEEKVQKRQFNKKLVREVNRKLFGVIRRRKKKKRNQMRN